jgi:hypothetical protein
MTSFIELYNQAEEERWAARFKRTVDKMSDVICVDKENNPNFLNPNLMNFYAHVCNQPDKVTASIRKACSTMPDGYNNIAVYMPSQKTWGLKFKCELC